MLVGLCLALPFRHEQAPAESLTADAAGDQLSLGEGVSLQLPGQKPAAPLEPQMPAPWTAESGPGDEQAAGSADAASWSATSTTPPALPDQYRPLYKPQLGTPESGRVLSPHAPHVPRRPVRRHTIHDGDTLESLAVRYLGDARRAPEILNANRDVLTDPKLLPIGLSLVIPTEGSPAAPTATPAAAPDEQTQLVPLPSVGFARGR